MRTTEQTRAMQDSAELMEYLARLEAIKTRLEELDILIKKYKNRNRGHYNALLNVYCALDDEMEALEDWIGLTSVRKY
jgi:DNA repair ATPase RecN